MCKIYLVRIRNEVIDKAKAEESGNNSGYYMHLVTVVSYSKPVLKTYAANFHVQISCIGNKESCLGHVF